MRYLLLALLILGCSTASNEAAEEVVESTDTVLDIAADIAPVDLVADISPEDLPVLPEVLEDVPSPEEIAPDLAPEIELPPDGPPFDLGPYGIVPWDKAGPFVLPTTKGDWDFEKEWGYGEDSYIFLSHAKGYDYVDQLWGSSISDMIKYSPANVHYFFMSYD